jgi:hypothetical protein
LAVSWVRFAQHESRTSILNFPCTHLSYAEIRETSSNARVPHPSRILAKGGTYEFNRPISTCYEKFMRPGRPKPSTVPNRPRETAPKFPSSRKGTPQVCRTNRGRKALPLCRVPHPNTLKSVEPLKMLGCPILRIFWRRVGRINSTGLFLGLQLCRIDQRNRTEISLQ